MVALAYQDQRWGGVQPPEEVAREWGEEEDRRPGQRQRRQEKGAGESSQGDGSRRGEAEDAEGPGEKI